MKMLARVWHTGIRPKPRRTSVQLTSTSATIPPTCYGAATRISNSTARLTVPPPEGGEPYFQSSLRLYLALLAVSLRSSSRLGRGVLDGGFGAIRGGGSFRLAD